MFLLALAACSGPKPETLVDELRVMAIAPAAPEVAPGGSTDVAVEVLDPSGAGGTVWVWACAPIGDTCLDAPTVAAFDASAPIVATVTVPEALGAVSSDTPAPLLPIWALAAAPDAAPPVGWSDDPANLADPTGLMATLAVHGTSLAVWPLSVSTRADVHPAPALVVTSAPASDGATAFTVTLDGDTLGATAFGYATSGGFSTTSAGFTASDAILTWLPTDSAAADVLIVVDDAEGGVATWRGTTGP